MSVETIVAYVRTERERGIPDAVIRVELEKKGWKERDISEVLPSDSAASNIVTGISQPYFQLSGIPERAALQLLVLGMILFLASSAMLFVAGAGKNLDNKLVFAAFALTHIVNGAAASLLFFVVWKLSRSFWFHLWIGLLSVIVGLFALSSFAHFASIATGVPFFDNLQRMLPGDDVYLPLIIYFVLLPLQSVVFLLLALTLWMFRFVRRRSGLIVPVLRPYLVPTGLFFVMALLAIGDLYIIMSKESFF